MKLIVFGGPKTGKSLRAKMLAQQHGAQLRCADALAATHDWSGASQAAADWMDEPGPWVIEGVAMARALRKWLAAHPTGKPCDAVHYLTKPHVEHSKGQAAMHKGCGTVWEEIEGELRRRGVEIK